jgi:hypothetical protein
MHRFRSWTLDPPEWRTQRNRLLPAEGGDGSTLSLDFTGGVLDPRLSFTRTTNATFINSRGYVEWANSNMYWNTAFEGLSGSNPSLTSSGWSYGGFTGGTAVFNGDGTVTVTVTTADRRAIFRSTGFTGGGLRVIASVDVTITSGSLPSNQVINTGNPANSQHYVNGVAWNNLHPLWPGSDVLPTNTPFNLSFATDSLTSGTTSVYFGIGCQGNGFAGSATFSNPRWTMWNGSATVPYYPNTSATNNSTADRYKSADYQAPRFDYDPTTLTPRGLLIEGSAVNYVLRSTVNPVSSPWSTAGTNLPTPTVDYTGGGFAPDNVTYPTRIQFGISSGGSPSRIIQQTTYTTNPTTANPYTVSVWMKSNTAGTNYTINLYSTTGNNLVTVTPTWQRFQVVNTSGTSLVGYIYIANESTSVAADVSIWGVQLEAGNGASSYIPTGGSTGSRTEDSATMAITAAQLGFDLNRYTMRVRGRQNKFGLSFARSVRLHDASTEQIGMPVNNNTLFGTSRNSSNAAIAEISAAATLNQDFRFAWALDADLATNTMLGSLNQSPLSASRTAVGPMGSTTTLSFNTNALGTAYASITIRDIKFWPRQMTASELNALTAG